MLPKIRSTLKHTAIILLLCFLLLPWPISSASVYEEKDSAINYTMSYPQKYFPSQYTIGEISISLTG